MKEMPYPSIEDIQNKQKSRNYKNLKSMIANAEPIDSDLRVKLNSDGFTDEQIIQALLSSFIPQVKSYDEIEIPAAKKADKKTPFESKGGRGEERQNRKSINYKNVIINLGKEDGVRPVTLLDFLKKFADLYPKNIGDIHLGTRETEFQIHPAALKRLEGINNKTIEGKKIKISYPRKG